MPLLSVVRDVCAVVGVDLPTSVFTGISSNRTMQEMVALGNEIAQRISYDTREWQRLKVPCTFTGDGVKTAFDLPANFKRMLLTANVWRSTSSAAPMRFVPDTDEWMNRRIRAYHDSRGEWTLMGGKMHIAPTLGVGVTVMFPYLCRDIIALVGGGFGETFLADGGQFVLDDRLLKLGMIWQWKAQKGSPYAEDMGTYGDALTLAMGNDSPSPIIIDHAPMSDSVRASVAYPWPVPT